MPIRTGSDSRLTINWSASPTSWTIAVMARSYSTDGMYMGRWRTTGLNAGSAVYADPNGSTLYTYTQTSAGGTSDSMAGEQSAYAGAAVAKMMLTRSGNTLTYFGPGFASGRAFDLASTAAVLSELASSDVLAFGAMVRAADVVSKLDVALCEGAAWAAVATSAEYAQYAANTKAELIGDSTFQAAMFDVWDIAPAGASGSAVADGTTFTGLKNGNVLTLVGTTATVSALASPVSRATAPVITGPSGAAGAATVTGGFTTDTADGTARMVWTQSATVPSVAQIKAGQDHTDSTSGVLVPTALTITSTGAKSFAAAAATTGLAYYGYVVHTNAAGADSNVLSLGAVYPGTWRPASDVTVTGWSVTGAATHAAALNENSPGSDSEYVTSPALTSQPVIEIIDLSSSMPAGTYSVKVRAKVSSGSGFVRVTALDAGNVSQGATADQAITGTLTTYDLPITTTGAATRYQIDVWN